MRKSDTQSFGSVIKFINGLPGENICFEITWVNHHKDVSVNIKDRTGKETPLHFRTDSAEPIKTTKVYAKSVPEGAYEFRIRAPFINDLMGIKLIKECGQDGKKPLVNFSNN